MLVEVKTKCFKIMYFFLDKYKFSDGIRKL